MNLNSIIEAQVASHNAAAEELTAQIAELTAQLEWHKAEAARHSESLAPKAVKLTEVHPIQWIDGRNGVEVHAPGCKDLKRQVTVLDTPSDVEKWASAEDFAKDFNADFYAEGVDHADGIAGCHQITFHACTKLVSKKTTITGY